MKHTYSIDELKNTNDSMMNYNVNVKYMGTLKVHVGMKGNHYQIIRSLVDKHMGKGAEIKDVTANGRPWKDNQDPFSK